jgi:hypothetical protein
MIFQHISTRFADKLPEYTQGPFKVFVEDTIFCEVKVVVSVSNDD